MINDDLHTVAEIIGDEPHKDEPLSRLQFEGFPEPGVYFGMPEEIYHAVPALSNSGMKNLRQSSMDFWARSWMMGERESDDTEAKARGRAYHKRILEGSMAFRAYYATALDKADFGEGLLVTMDDLKAELAKWGEKPGSGKTQAITRLLNLDPTAKIWDVLCANHAELHEGRQMLSAKEMRQLELAAAMIERHPTLSKAFTGGYSEVSIFWYCEKTGVPMKARLDYLKQRAIVDLKTLANQQGKPFQLAVAYEIASRKYHVQVAVYDEAVAAAKDMFKQKNMGCVFGDDTAVPPLEWLQAWSSADRPVFMFVFQQTGVAPVARGYVMPHHNVVEIGRMSAQQSKQQFRQCWQTFGSEPWVDTTDIHTFDDTEFPVFISDL